MNRTLEKSRVTEAIIKGVFELNILTNDFLLHSGERAKIQWQSRYNTITEIIQTEVFERLEEQELLDNLRNGQESIGAIFSKLFVNQEEKLFSQELEERLVSQLWIKSQIMVSTASKLNEMVHLELISQQQKLNLFVMAAILMLILITVISSLLIIGAVAKPIAILQKGAKKIGRGKTGTNIAW